MVMYYCRYIRLILCIFIFLFIACNAFTQQNDLVVDETTLFLEDRANQTVDVNSLGVWDIIRVFLILIFVLVIGAGLLYLVKRLQSPRHSTHDDIIEIVASRGLTTGSTLHLVKLANRFILIGNSSQSINSIKEITQKEEIDEINLALSKTEESNKTHQKLSFIQKLHKKIKFTQTVSMAPISNSPPQKNSSLVSFFRGSEKRT